MGTVTYNDDITTGDKVVVGILAMLMLVMLMLAVTPEPKPAYYLPPTTQPVEPE